LKGKKIAIWGLAFKPRTDDVREAPALLIIETLLKSGASVVDFDPVATENAKLSLKSNPRLKFARDQYAAVDGADALVVATEWDEFRTADFADLQKRMKGTVIVDGRNIFERDEAEAAGFTYYGVGV
jgi:UDPglucose 6-dehydrogenase